METIGEYRSIAVDGTLLLAADSYITKTSNNEIDPAAPWAFIVVTSYFCSNRDLYYPTPASDVTSAFPIFDLWTKHSFPVRNLALTTLGINSIIGGLKSRFEKKLIDDPGDINQWISFQLADEMIQQYLSAGNAYNELPVFAEEISNITNNPKIVTTINDSRKWNITHPNFRQIIKNAHITDLQFALAYTFQCFSKGVLYGLGFRVERNPKSSYLYATLATGRECFRF